MYKKTANKSQLLYITNMRFTVKKKKKKKLHMFKMLYKSYLMNVGIIKSARAIMELPLSYFRFKNISSFTTLNSD